MIVNVVKENILIILLSSIKALYSGKGCVETYIVQCTTITLSYIPIIV